MTEIRNAETETRRYTVVAPLILYAAVVGVSYACDRAYRRWLRENHPLAGPRTRLHRMRTDFQDRRAIVTEVAQLVGSVLVEVAGATSTSGSR